MQSLTEIAEQRRKQETESLALVKDEVSNIIKNLNDSITRGTLLQSITITEMEEGEMVVKTLLDKASELPEFQEAMKRHHDAFNFKTEVEVAGMTLGKLKKTAPVLLIRARQTLDKDLIVKIEDFQAKIARKARTVRGNQLQPDDAVEIKKYAEEAKGYSEQLPALAKRSQ